MKIGIEIHQRLGTKEKLFCHCPANAEGRKIRHIYRRQRPIAGELGEVDPATMYEYFRDRVFEYSVSEMTCMVETDSDFPFPVNKEALEIAFQIAMLFKMDVPDTAYIMRKIVTDGSNTSGYQRTILIGLGNENSVVPTSQGSVKISTLQLEEESAVPFGNDGFISYNVDRLGIPLVEIGTEADIKTPEQALEVAEYIGTLLRSVKVARGIGTIRQDVNVSIPEGNRVEIKGFQDLKNIPLLIKNEMNRQKALLEIKKKLNGKNMKKREIKLVTKTFENSKCSLVSDALGNDNGVLGVVLPEIREFMKMDCGGHTFGKELSFYVHAYGLKGMIHSEEDMEKYNLKDEFMKLDSELHKNEKDVIAILIGEEKTIRKAADALLNRIEFLYNGIPKETRVALPDATTKYTRPLPGSGRLYPETDLPNLKVDKNYLNIVKKNIPLTLFEKMKILEAQLPKELATQLIRSKYLELYDHLIKRRIEPKLAATILLTIFTDLKRQGVAVDEISKDRSFSLLKVVDKKISKDVLPNALTMLAHGKSLDQVCDKYGLLPQSKLKEMVLKIMAEKPGLNEKALIGLVMSNAKGRVSGKQTAEMINRAMKK